MNFKPAPIIYFFCIATQHNIPEEYKSRFGKKRTYRKAKGPQGKIGYLMAPYSDVLLEYNETNYKWHKYKDIHIGIRKDYSPEDFINDECVAGYRTTLGDNKEWTIPVALLSSHNFSLPRYEAPNEEGIWEWHVKEKYEFLSIIAQDIWNNIGEDAKLTMDEEKVRYFCCEALAVNYNLSSIECGLLGILTESSYKAILDSVIDMPGKYEIMQHLQVGKNGKKKRLSEENGTYSGNSD